MHEKLICLTLDVCEDIHAPDAAWGYLQSIQAIRDKIERHLNRRGYPCRITWFPRADHAIEREMGSATALFERVPFMEFEALGDEIGWHAHFYDEQGNQVIVGNEIAEEAGKVILEVKKLLPNVESSRFGRLHVTNELLEVLVELGFRQDANCLPGRKQSRENMTFDWSLSPSRPFYPGKSDYRIPGKPCFPILEMPYAMKPMQTSYDNEQVNRYVNIAFHHELIAEGIESIDVSWPIVLVTHPFELLHHDHKHGLIAFDLDEALYNLDLIIDYFQGKNKPIRFVTLKEAGRIWRESHE